MYDILVAPFALPFMARALVVMLMLSLVAGVVGAMVNLRRLEFLSDGLVHAVFPGVVVGHAIAGSAGLLAGGTVAAVAGAITLTLIGRRGVPSDAAIAVVLTGMFSLGVIVVSEQSDYAGQLSEMLFGRVLTVADSDIVGTAILGAVALALVLATAKEQVFRAFDPQSAEAAGFRLLALDLVLNVAVALVVVAASRALGTLLMLALLVVPVAVGRLLSVTVRTMSLLAVAVGAVGGWLGLALSFRASVSWGVALPGGATVVVVLVAMLGLGLAVWAALRWTPRTRLASAVRTRS